MRKLFLVVLNKSTVVHGFMAVLLADIKPFPSRSYRYTTQTLKAKLLSLLYLIYFLRANLLPLSFPSLFKSNSSSNLPHQSAMNLSIGILRE